MKKRVLGLSVVALAAVATTVATVASAGTDQWPKTPALSCAIELQTADKGLVGAANRVLTLEPVTDPSLSGITGPGGIKIYQWAVQKNVSIGRFDGAGGNQLLLDIRVLSYVSSPEGAPVSTVAWIEMDSRLQHTTDPGGTKPETNHVTVLGAAEDSSLDLGASGNTIPEQTVYAVASIQNTSILDKLIRAGLVSKTDAQSREAIAEAYRQGLAMGLYREATNDPFLVRVRCGAGPGLSDVRL